MALTKHASFQVLAARIAQAGAPLMRTAHRVEFEYEPRPGFLYVRSRAISSRCNDNFDEFPAEEIKKAYRTFIGKPVFVNHHNANHRRARGVIIDAALHEDVNPDGTPDTWVEVLMEVDAVKFPKLAEAIVKGHIERTSMGTDVAYSICSACGNKASSPLEYCQHIPRMKGKRIYRTTASGHKEGVLIREICYGLGFFENSLLVEDPADPTAYFLGVDTRGMEMTASKTAAVRVYSASFLVHPAQGRTPDDYAGEATYAVPEGALIAASARPVTDLAEVRLRFWAATPEVAQGIAERALAACSRQSHGADSLRITPGRATASDGAPPTTAAKDKYVAPSSTKDPDRYEGVTIKQDGEGYYVHTHRARSDSYPSPEAIPASVISEIEATGVRTTATVRPISSGVSITVPPVTAKVASKAAISFDQGGRVVAPAEVDTLRDEQCPVCGESDSYDGDKCQVCGFIRPPEEFGDPDLSKAKQVDLHQDAAEDSGERLQCDNCQAQFSGGVKVAVVLDPDRGARDAQGDDAQIEQGQTCPECQQGTLHLVPTSQNTGEDPKVPSQADDFAPAGSADPEQGDEDDDFAPAADEDDDFAPAAADDDEQDSSSTEDEGDEDDDEDKPPFLRKKPTAARRGSSTRRSTVEMARPALAALMEQQKMIEAQRGQIARLTDAVTFLARAAGVGAHPKFASLTKAAADDDENPAQPDGWATSDEGAESPAATTDEASTPSGTDDPTDQGAGPLTDATPDATTSVTDTETVLDEPLDLNEQDVTEQVEGTDTLGKGERGEAGTNRTETEVRIGDPNNPQSAFDDDGFLSEGAKRQERTMASLRLARLQIQAGIASGDDLVMGQTIASSEVSDDAIEAQIETLAKVVAARPAAQERRPVARNLVPQAARTAGRSVPSLAAEAAVPTQEISTPVREDEILW